MSNPFGHAETDTEMSAFERDFQAWRKSRAEALQDGFGELSCYRSANVALRAAAPDEGRVVFF
ncbi:MAG: hypothetical protein WAM63_02195, partial [Rhodomicrobium sp.]